MRCHDLHLEAVLAEILRVLFAATALRILVEGRFARRCRAGERRARECHAEKQRKDVEEAHPGFSVQRVAIRPRGLCSSSRRPRSEEHTSELQSLMRISYAVFCLKKKKTK